METNEIDVFLEEMASTPYKEKHWPENQKRIVDGFYINPSLREGFDMTPNENRDELEIEHWWCRPFILEEEYQAPDNTYSEYVERMKSYPDYTNDKSLKSQKEWNIFSEEDKESFYKSFPSGKAYTLRCLDGGAWDRSTWRGDFKSLEDAVFQANELCN